MTLKALFGQSKTSKIDDEYSEKYRAAWVEYRKWFEAERKRQMKARPKDEYRIIPGKGTWDIERLMFDHQHNYFFPYPTVVPANWSPPSPPPKERKHDFWGFRTTGFSFKTLDEAKRTLKQLIASPYTFDAKGKPCKAPYRHQFLIYERGA